MRVLFVTWDGPQLSYAESLFLPIFERLSAHGFQFDILQFSWGDDDFTNRLRRACERAGVGYRRVDIWRQPRPLGPFLSAIAGGRHINRAARTFGSDIVMPRSIMPALATLAASRKLGLPVLYDADGLAADERVDFAGLSARNPIYRAMRAIETRMTRAAKAIIVRSDFATEVLRERAGPAANPHRFFVVANGRDPEIFKPFEAADRAAMRAQLGISQTAPLIVYAGSVGRQYDTGRIATFIQALRTRRPDARLLLLSSDHEAARTIILGRAAEVEECSIFMQATPAEVPRYLATADLGLAFRKSSFSMRAVSPIKTGEYLLCGVPVLGSGSVGDTVAAQAAGVFLDDAAGDEDAADWFVNQINPGREEYRQRARAAGIERFSLDRSVEDYMKALKTFRSSSTGRGSSGNSQRD